MLPTAERLHKSKAPTEEKAGLLKLPCTWPWRDEAHRVVTRIGNYTICIVAHTFPYPNILWQSARMRAELQARSGAIRSELCSISYTNF